jgi:cell division protein FtsL
MKSYERENQHKLDRIEARLTRHEKVTRITLTVVMILAGLALALVAYHLSGDSTIRTK